MRRLCCCYLSGTASTPGSSTGPPVLNRSPLARKVKKIRRGKFHLGLVLGLLNFSGGVEWWGGETRLHWVLKWLGSEAVKTSLK